MTRGNNLGTQRVVRYLSGFGAGVRFGVHNSTLINIMRGVVERVLYTPSAGGLQRPPRPLAGVFNRLSSIRAALVGAARRTTVVPRAEYSALYTGRKRGIYQRAYESLSLKPITKRDSYVSTFVKAEKINFSAKGDPAPRVIQPRSPRYNLEVGRYLKLFEHSLFEAFEKVFGYRVILKGLNADGMAACLRSSWDSFGDPVALGLDASRFDQHVSRAALEYEHSVYNEVFKSPELAKLLSWQLHNRGYGRVGDCCVKYEVDGCRMSGDINTSLGNCLIMASIVLGYLSHYGIDGRLANNGDDCIVFVERRDYYKLSGLPQWFTDFGFKLTTDPPVDTFEQIVFCQTQPVMVGSGWRMVRDPFTAMSKDCVSLLGWDGPEQFATWRDAIGTCGLELTSGVPVWESFYRAIKSGDRQGGLEHVYETGLGYWARGVQRCAITDDARFSFWRAFGITPDDQVVLEESWPEISWGDPQGLMFTDIAPQSAVKWLRNAKERNETRRRCNG